MQLQAIFFDYGGTLDGQASHWLDRFVGLYGQAGVPRAFEEIKDAFYTADEACYGDPRIAETGLADLMERHVGVQLDRLGLANPDLHRWLVEQFLRSCTTSLAASRRVLERLHPALRLGVVSNFYGNVERILAEAGFGPLLSVVADSHRVGLSKPDPRIYRWAVDRLGIPASAVLHVGDSHERDVAAARAAGLRTAWLVGDRPAPVADPPPDLVLRSLDELQAYVEVES